MQKTAESRNLQKYLGKCLMLQGYIYLSYGRANEASTELIKAVEIFSELKLEENLRQAECFAAIAMGKN